MIPELLALVLGLAAGGALAWLALAPKLQRAINESAALKASLEIAGDQLTAAQGDLATVKSELAAVRAELDKILQKKRKELEEPLTRDEFRTKLFRMIDSQVEEFVQAKRAAKADSDQPGMQAKEAAKRVLDYSEASAVTAKVRKLFADTIHAVPEQVEMSCLLSEAILAPTTALKKELLKKAAKIGGVAGIGLIVVAACTAIGLAHGVVGLIFAFLVGGPHLPLGLLIAGVTLSGIAAYFALSGNPEIDTDRFEKP
jgi:hypothetical protein